MTTSNGIVTRGISDISQESCASCGKPAAWRSTMDPEELHCETCAFRYGSEARGQARGALDTLGFAIQQARHAGLDDSEIRAAVHDILSAAHSTGFFPVGGDVALGADFNRDLPWLRTYAPIAGGGDGRAAE